MTEKCYYQDIHTLEFEAQVIDVEKNKKGWRVRLDKTYFYPEGGGQPADKGWLNDIPVIDVRKEEGDIYHYLTENPGTGTVKGKIDPGRREDFMQQHTGQHIISGALWKVGKNKTLSVHMGIDYTTIEIDAPTIPEADLIKVEDLANEVINSDLPLRFIETSHRDLDKFPLRKPTGLTGKIRLVRIGDFDCVACGGLHFESTRKVGLVKATGMEKIRGNARITWKIGTRAYEDYRKKDKIISELKPVLSTKEEMFVEKVTELQDEIIEAKRKNNRLENRLAEITAHSLYESHREEDGSPYRVITAVRHEEDGDFLKKRSATAVHKGTGNPAPNRIDEKVYSFSTLPGSIKKVMKELLKRDNAVICLVDVLADKLQWSIGCSENIDLPFQEIKNDLLPLIDGKGGGRPPLWQGTGRKTGQVDEFLAGFKSLVLNLPKNRD